MGVYNTDEESVNQYCIVCFANAKAAMEHLGEIEVILKKISLKFEVRSVLNEKIKTAWHALFLRRNICHGHHSMEIKKS